MRNVFVFEALILQEENKTLHLLFVKSTEPFAFFGSNIYFSNAEHFANQRNV